MRLFISYARIDKAYCIRVVDVLNAHTIWYDQRLYAGQNWWKEILRRLEWCDGFVYIISRDSLESDYCKREFEIAQSMGKPIIPIVIHPDVNIPEHLLDVQYIDISGGLTVENVKLLLDSVHLIAYEHARSATVRTTPVISTAVIEEDNSDLLTRAVKAMEKGDYDRAVFLLNRFQESGVEQRFINVEALLKEAEHALKNVMRQREIERDYEQIRQLMNLDVTHKLGCEAFQKFHAAHPDYDPHNLAAMCMGYINHTTLPVYSNGTNGSNGHHAEVSENGTKKAKGVVPFEWCKIPVGRVKNAEGSYIHVDEFHMSKYPITNAHYQAFIKDPKGYNNVSWWKFCGAATEWRLQNVKPVSPTFQGANRPRENVTWYDAMAYCRWLSNKLNMRITLPTLAQRQRAIQGEDEREYPWGNVFDKDCCNSRESEIRMTTFVNRYENGVSPYQVWDLVGNLWEWCLDEVDSNAQYNDEELSRAKKRIVHGGAFISEQQQCCSSFSFSVRSRTPFKSIGFRVVRLLD
jgi:formylglycine-generating enzyme required for sulfatase activity